MYRTDWLYSLKFFNARQDHLEHIVAIEITSFKQRVGTQRSMKPCVFAVLRDEGFCTGPDVSFRCHGHRWPRQYFCHFAAHPPSIMLHDTSPDCGDWQNAAVLLPPAPPSDTQVIRGPLTRICPSRDTPVARPIRLTNASRASMGSASGQGWPALHVPLISRAATPDNRTCGPSAHQIGPSPSQTRIGVH